MRSHGLFAAAAAVALTACQGGSAAPPAVPAQAGTHAVARAAQGHDAGQDLQVSPAALTFAGCSTASQSFDATEIFESDITAVSANPSIVSLDAAVVRNAVDPGSGGLKHARFSVTPEPLAAGSTTITVTDKKGNTATVSVTVIGCR
ncbi:MAG: hypothetical protein JWM87_4507 [Candidatus Eremiobacteraeota bacterium]|nr:hypothetical protein [Candidatus Eremiobacteraeota bacterium]